MAIASSDLILFWSASVPKSDTGASGGAIDATYRPVFAQIAANDTIEAVSDGADTRSITVYGRKADGTITSETKALNGATFISLSTLGTVERVLWAYVASTSVSRTVTVRRTTASTLIATIPVNEIGFVLAMYDSASAVGETIRYEKVFWKNTHATLALNNAQIQITADPSTKFKMAVCSAKGGSGTATNRLTAPTASGDGSGLSFVDDSVQQAVPTGALGSGENIGVWLQMTLAGSAAPVRSTVTLELAGTSV